MWKAILQLIGALALLYLAGVAGWTARAIYFHGQKPEPQPVGAVADCLSADGVRTVYTLAAILTGADGTVVEPLSPAVTCAPLKATIADACRKVDGGMNGIEACSAVNIATSTSSPPR